MAPHPLVAGGAGQTIKFESSSPTASASSSSARSSIAPAALSSWRAYPAHRLDLAAFSLTTCFSDPQCSDLLARTALGFQLSVLGDQVGAGGTLDRDSRTGHTYLDQLATSNNATYMCGRLHPDGRALCTHLGQLAASCGHTYSRDALHRDGPASLAYMETLFPFSIVSYPCGAVHGDSLARYAYLRQPSTYDTFSRFGNDLHWLAER